MERDSFNDHFTRFPYRKERHEDGQINNGGIDLVAEPGRIDEIHEALDVPWLKRFLQDVNSPDG